ncbi:GDYXXLXY domain-containing protein [Sulfurimonas marina]|uniref:GDYXXLXY domain-containing protein n=1 Tax=Sulfurimonas marina TaxID=2590551 RepID=A0A7M1AWR7_9BACT|nr:GDYXXLXY domain-containing protein [Sulfurimonas marina]QOP41018.1 GDYXXLXY domain-containing protein [Sulfurimonas marina]
MANKIALVSLIIVLTLVNWSIYKKEQHLKEGEVVYLELAPVDPRSLMQGDYMALRFKVANEIREKLPKKNTILEPQEGDVIVSLAENRVATYKALYKGQDLAVNELRIHYRVRNRQVKFATNAFFFKEGEGKRYEAARYGEFRVDNGEVLLINLYDKELKRL